MRITSIELAGTSRTMLRDGTPGLPQAFARLSRKAGEEYIEVEVVTPAATRKHLVHADDEDDQRSMAAILQEALDGHEGTNSMVHDYLRVIQYLAD